MGPLVTMEQLVDHLVGRTGVTRGEIRLVLSEFNEAVIYYANRGVPVQLEGLGIFLPSIMLSGRKKVNLRRDVSFRKALNADDAWHGRLINSENIGKTSDELVSMWNEAHPDDPVEE